MRGETNLVPNGDFALGTQYWSGGGITAVGGVATATGSIYNSEFIPLSNGRRYRLTFDIMFTNVNGSYWYIALMPYDAKRTSVGISTTNKPFGSNLNTTLAAELKSGDTTVTLTSASGWPTSRSYQRVGICNIKAWGYNRCSASYSYSSISGNVVTLKSAYTGSTFPAGTQVSEFEDGSTYYYPKILSSANMPTEWTTYTVEFNGGDNIRHSTQFVKFSTLGYSHTYSMRNIKIECISDYQECIDYKYNITPTISKNGVVLFGNILDRGMFIRYVRDTMNGSTANAHNHWCELKVIDNSGNNVALGKDVTIGSTTYSNSIITDGIVDSQWVGTSPASLTLDIGYITLVDKIIIWHYYPDGRTYYNNIVEVSCDGQTWYTVYSGEKPETSAGNEIVLSPQYGVVRETGQGLFNDFVEY